MYISSDGILQTNIPCFLPKSRACLATIVLEILDNVTVQEKYGKGRKKSTYCLLM